MKVCIVGAGNIGLVAAGVISLSGQHEVTVFTNSAFDTSSFCFEDCEQTAVYSNLPIKVSGDFLSASRGADYILCTYPAFLRRRFITDFGALIEKSTSLGFIPGYGGAEYACAQLIERGITVFGLQRVPFVARQKNRSIASLLSRKNTLYVASIPKVHTNRICCDIEALFGIHTLPLHHYLAVTLVPSNPLLHLTGLYNVFKAWRPGDSFDYQLMFYDEWNNEASEMLFKYDDELQAICNKMPFDLSEVVSLKDYYQAPTAEKMTEKLKSIEAFKVVQVPLLRRNDGRFVPDFNSRMFTEDFPFGAAIIKGYANLTDTDTPTIDEILRFYSEKTGIEYFDKLGRPTALIGETGVPQIFGLMSIDDIAHYYR